MIILRNSEKTSVFNSGPFIWISVSKCKSADPVFVAESVLATMKGDDKLKL